MVDRLTGYVKCEMTSNKGTDAAISGIKNWGALYGFPHKCIADGGPVFRDDFTKKITKLNIKHVPSSSYHSQSNSLAECGVQSVKNCIKKSAERFTTLHLNEMVFSINTTESSEGTGSPSDRFFGRALRTNLPNSVNPDIKVDELIRKRIEKPDFGYNKKNKREKKYYMK